MTYTYEGDIKTSDVSNTVSDSIGDKCTVTLGENTGNAGKTVEIKFSSTKGISDDKQNTLKTALEKDFPDNNIEVYESNDVAASSGMNFFFKCLAACALAMVITIIYIGFRFKKIGGISAGVFSVVALAHDMCMVYGCFVICRCKPLYYTDNGTFYPYNCYNSSCYGYSLYRLHNLRSNIYPELCFPTYHRYDIRCLFF